MTDGIVIVGGSLAAVTAAETLRTEGFDGPVTIISGEAHPPYARPPLSKGLLTGSQQAQDIRLALNTQGVMIRTGIRATALDPERRRVRLADGDQVPYDGLLIATGARARRLTAVGDGALVVRELDDAFVVREAFARAARVAIIGGGFLGMELASAARATGAQVVVIDRAPPLVSQLGPLLARIVTRAARAAGVELRISSELRRLDTSHDGMVLELPGAGRVEADVTVVAAGCQPNVEWLQSASLGGPTGLAVDARCRVAPAIAAAGDVVLAPGAPGAPARRTPHWSSAIEQAEVAAAALVHGDHARVLAPQPYVWTEAFGIELKVAGRLPARGRPRLIEGSLAEPRALLQWSDRGIPNAAVAINYRAPVTRLRRLSRPTAC